MYLGYFTVGSIERWKEHIANGFSKASVREESKPLSSGHFFNSFECPATRVFLRFIYTQVLW